MRPRHDGIVVATSMRSNVQISLQLTKRTSSTSQEFLPEALPRLREPVLHVAADLRTLGRAEEIGLDLHRARDLVERLRGEMRVDPEDGQGDVETRHDVEQVAGQTAGGAVALLEPRDLRAHRHGPRHPPQLERALGGQDEWLAVSE